jgi:hypothetical protein
MYKGSHHQLPILDFLENCIKKTRENVIVLKLVLSKKDLQYNS